MNNTRTWRLVRALSSNTLLVEVLKKKKKRSLLSSHRLMRSCPDEPITGSEFSLPTHNEDCQRQLWFFFLFTHQRDHQGIKTNQSQTHNSRVCLEEKGTTNKKRLIIMSASWLAKTMRSIRARTPRRMFLSSRPMQAVSQTVSIRNGLER